MSPLAASTLAGFARLEAAARHTPRTRARLAWCNRCKAATMHYQRKRCSVCARHEEPAHEPAHPRP